jgi:hypothetical protein
MAVMRRSMVRKIDGRWRVVATQNTDVRHGRRH